MTPAEKIVADNHVAQRLNHWIAQCQDDNSIPAILVTFGNGENPDSMEVIAPQEYPLHFVAILLQGALARVEEEMVREAGAGTTQLRQ